jgi:hypothetical protein
LGGCSFHQDNLPSFLLQHNSSLVSEQKHLRTSVVSWGKHCQHPLSEYCTWCNTYRFSQDQWCRWTKVIQWSTFKRVSSLFTAS